MLSMQARFALFTYVKRFLCYLPCTFFTTYIDKIAFYVIYTSAFCTIFIGKNVFKVIYTCTFYAIYINNIAFYDFLTCTFYDTFTKTFCAL